MRILVVEDNETMRGGMLAVLKRMGHEASGAPSGKQGLELFGELHPDLVITDLKMEGMDGVEVLRLVKEKEPLTPVIMVTAYGTVDTAVEAMKVGAFDFVTKPVSPDVLRLKVNAAKERIESIRKQERLEARCEYLEEELGQRAQA